MKIALSFDVEEFDTPKIDYGVPISAARQIDISGQGLTAILEMMEHLGIRGTFFCTAHFATQRPELIRRIVAQGHELASHSYHHSDFKASDLLSSRLKLEEIGGVSVRGYRAPRMSEVKAEQLLEAGYRWDSSLNPCFIPGRYNHFRSPRRPYREACGLIEIPASVATAARIPLFWLALHNFPLGMYRWLCGRALRETGVLNIYFHPWEFSPELRDPTLKLPRLITKNSGQQLIDRLNAIISRFRARGVEFVTLSEVAEEVEEG